MGVLFAWVAIAPTPAQANCAALSLCSCTVSTTGISFGSYDPVSSANTDSTGSVRVVCTLLVALAGSYRIDLSTGSSGSYAQRTLTNGPSILNYNLYTDVAYGQIVGNGSGGSSSITSNFLALLFLDQSTTIYGRIPGSQNVSAGSYSDTITVTVTY
ncbi:SCPU domain-containing protein (plasmid) [Sphingomonas paeninsulae]|uniref:SCPU domain-containing protein n=1 Tax=Sphingomonas paeninsulae TaxID=2319844 RepID=A0A494T7Y4_SPHPE|nr:spore coat U domain-containing protein [Sphingomonas paeninsulae]AYJ85427.1 SCPU domain-containing protein [Sphingomonas paeninsulae]